MQEVKAQEEVELLPEDTKVLSQDQVIQRRVPKFGFRSPNRIETKPINLDTIQELCESSKVKEINLEFLIKNGYARKNDLVKVLGRGKLKAKVNVSAHYFSASAIKAIEKAGGKIKKLIND